MRSAKPHFSMKYKLHKSVSGKVDWGHFQGPLEKSQIVQLISSGGISHGDYIVEDAPLPQEWVVGSKAWLNCNLADTEVPLGACRTEKSALPSVRPIFSRLLA